MKEAQEKKLFLLDAYALIYRAYFAFINNPLRNSKGMNVSAIAGFTQLIADLLQKEKPTHMAVVFDSAEETTTRAATFEWYKANRQEMPEDIAQSIPWIKKIIEAFNIPSIEMPGYEADDIIGTIAKKKAAENFTVYMVTSDKDYAQLVSEKVKIYKPGRQGSEVEILGVHEVKEKWEVENPAQVADVLGLMGDSVDNIPGIKGIGEKTAKKLIKEYGSLENVIAHANEIKGKLGENIREHAEMGLISKQLATIILDVPIEIDNNNLLVNEPNREALGALFSELEFRAIGKRILGEDFTFQSKPNFSISAKNEAAIQRSLFDEPSALSQHQGRNIHNTPHKYYIVSDKMPHTLGNLKNIGVDEFIDKLNCVEEFCFDTETSSLDYFTLDLVGFSFCLKPGEAYYVPCPQSFESTRKLLERFKPLFESKSTLKIGQNIKFDMHVLRRYGITISEPFYDTMVAHYLIEPDLRHNMDYLSEVYLGYTPISIENLIGKKGKNQGSMRDVPIHIAAEYAAEDADITFQLKQVFQPLVKEKEVDNVLEEIELPLIPILVDMEYQGVNIDCAFLKEYSLKLDKELHQLKEKIYEYAGRPFNIDSPKQLTEVLYKELKLPFEGKKTSTGQLSTNEEALQGLAKHHPIATAILEFREVSKLKSTYVDALPQMVHPVTKRVHTTFNQTIAATGRLSSVSPNLQNIPIRTERGQQVRKAFIARDKEHLLLSADYSQIELRLVAEISGDKAMLEAFDSGLDIHAATASKVYGVPIDKVTKAQRNNAKMVNFGIIYAITPYGLSQRLGIPKKDAAELIDNYFKQFPGIKSYMENTLYFARKHGYVQTIKGRKRFLKDINSRNATVRGVAEREAINAPIQGSAADMIKIAMINIFHEFKKQKLNAAMTLQVHDELIFDVPVNEIEKVKEIVSYHMKHALETRVPIVVEMGTGNNWLEAH